MRLIAGIKRSWHKLSLTWQRPAQRNIWYLYLDVIFAAFVGAASSFSGAYVLRLGGSSGMVGLLSSLPAVLAVFLYLPCGQLLERKERYTPWVVGGLFLSRLRYLIVALLPWLLGDYLPQLTVGVLVAFSMPLTLFSTGWSPMLADIIPQSARGTVLSWRSMLNSGTVALITLLAGRLLEQGTFPGNYQWLYGLAFVGGMFSIAAISRIVVPKAGPSSVDTSVGKRQNWWQVLRSLPQDNPRYMHLIVNTFVFDAGAWLLAPLYIIFFVRSLGAGDGWIGLNTTLGHVGVVAGYWLWRRVSQRVGAHRALLLAAPLAATYAFMVAAVPNLSAILLAGLLVNTFNPGVALNHSMIMMDLLPPGRRHSAVALYSMMMNIGAFLFPLLGVALSEWIGIRGVLWLGGAIRMLGAFLFCLWPIHDDRLELDFWRRKSPRPIRWPWRKRD